MFLMMLVVISLTSLLLRSTTLPFAMAIFEPASEQQRVEPELVEDEPLQGEWISGKTPKLTFQQPLIGSLKALPKPWL